MDLRMMVLFTATVLALNPFYQTRTERERVPFVPPRPARQEVDRATDSTNVVAFRKTKAG